MRTARRISSTIINNFGPRYQANTLVESPFRRYTQTASTPSSVLPSASKQAYNETHPKVDERRQTTPLSTIMPVNAVDFPELQACLTSNAEWAARTHADEPGFFERSAKGQKPFLLWIGCESRADGGVTSGPRSGAHQKSSSSSLRHDLVLIALTRPTSPPLFSYTLGILPRPHRRRLSSPRIRRPRQETRRDLCPPKHRQPVSTGRR